MRANFFLDTNILGYLLDSIAEKCRFPNGWFLRRLKWKWNDQHPGDTGISHPGRG